jgi:hypothetical protein
VDIARTVAGRSANVQPPADLHEYANRIGAAQSPVRLTGRDGLVGCEQVVWDRGPSCVKLRARKREIARDWPFGYGDRKSEIEAFVSVCLAFSPWCLSRLPIFGRR